MQLPSALTLTLILASVFFCTTSILASPLQLHGFQEAAQAVFGSAFATPQKEKHYVCPEHDKTGWALSFLPLSPGAFYPYKRLAATRLDRVIRVTTNRIDRTVDIIGNGVEEQMCCLYPINTSDSSSLCFYSKLSGELVEDRNRGNCASIAKLVAET